MGKELYKTGGEAQTTLVAVHACAYGDPLITYDDVEFEVGQYSAGM